MVNNSYRQNYKFNIIYTYELRVKEKLNKTIYNLYVDVSVYSQNIHYIQIIIDYYYYYYYYKYSIASKNLNETAFFAYSSRVNNLLSYFYLNFLFSQSYVLVVVHHSICIGRLNIQ